MKKDPILKFLGRGSMFNVEQGNNAAYWKDGDFMLLIDCGGTVFRRIKKLKLLDGVKELDILITHCHSDHIGSLSDLLFYVAFVYPDINVNIGSGTTNSSALLQYLDSTGTALVIDSSDKINYIACPSISKMVARDSVQTYCEIKFVDDFSHKVGHINSTIGSNNTGLLIKFPDRIIYYSGDTQSVPFDQIDMRYIDELYIDCAVRINSPGSSEKYPHYTLYDLHNDLSAIKYPLENVYAMHIDCAGVIDECKRFGINVVEVEL